MNSNKMVVTDLDDTLLTFNKILTSNNIETLKNLRKNNITIVIATGRPLHFIKRIDHLEDLSDYFITSTGLGIWNCNTKEMILKKCFTAKQTIDITDYLNKNNISFMRHQELPKNHYCQIYSNGINNDDLNKRALNFKNFILPKTNDKNFKASLFMLPGVKSLELFNKLKNDLKDVSLIRLASPYSPENMWIEILPLNVDKGYAVEELTKLLSIPKGNRVIVGNDHNDTAMLNLSKRSYVVSNAVKELKRKFIIVNDCNHEGFTDAVKKAGLI